MGEAPDLHRLLRGLTPSQAPHGLWENIRAELDRPARRVPLLRRPLRSPSLVAAAVLLALVGGSIVGLASTYDAPSSWRVAPLAGAPTIAGAPLTDTGAIRTGEWLITDSESRAELAVGRIGTAQVGPNSRVRLDRGGFTDHRLTLERGSLRAVITAPPRLFFVQTPTALATDLGCAYTLEVDGAGTSRIRVTAGWVELRQNGRVSLVPAGLVAQVEMDEGPGTPYPQDFPDDAQAALQRLDRGSGSDADLDLVFAELSTPDDPVTLRLRSGITLWHVLQRVDGVMRERVYLQLAELAPPPEGVTREGILALERPMLERWRRDLHPMWSEEAQPLLSRIARRVWDWTMR